MVIISEFICSQEVEQRRKTSGQTERLLMFYNDSKTLLGLINHMMYVTS